MRYKAAPGVVMTTVCGKYFLVTPKETLQVNEPAALYWKALVKGADEEELRKLAEEEYRIEDHTLLRRDIREMLESLAERRMLLRYDV